MVIWHHPLVKCHVPAQGEEASAGPTLPPKQWYSTQYFNLLSLLLLVEKTQHGTAEIICQHDAYANMIRAWVMQFLHFVGL